MSGRDGLAFWRPLMRSACGPASSGWADLWTSLPRRCAMVTHSVEGEEGVVCLPSNSRHPVSENHSIAQRHWVAVLVDRTGDD